MVVKKRSVKAPSHTVTVEASAPLEEAAAKEEKRSPVTQVVEVVEETPQSTTTQTQPTVEPVKPLEMPSTQQDVSTPQGITEAPAPQPAPPMDQASEEKRKEVVDELFQNKPQSPSAVMPEISVHTKQSSQPIVLWAIVLVVACLVVGVSLLFVSGKKGVLPSIVSVPTPTATPTAKPAPVASQSAMKRSDITIQVLNGGGKAGAATKMKTFLEGKGYTVGDTGNADSYTYDTTEIMVKASKKVYLSLLENDLKDTYTLGTSSATLDDTVSFDARVIVGKE